MDDLGNYYALAYAYNGVSTYSTKIIKFSPSGIVDSSFGSNGVADVGISFTASYKINVLINNTTNKLLVYNKNNLVQLNANGTIDTSFATNGTFDLSTLVTDFTAGAILAKGTNYFIGGHLNTGAVLFKMNTAAALDPTFGTNSGYYMENGLSNPAYVAINDMFFLNPDTLLIYSAIGLKKYSKLVFKLLFRTARDRVRFVMVEMIYKKAPKYSGLFIVINYDTLLCFLNVLG